MAKHPPKQTIWHRAWAMARRNPFKTATAVLGFLAVVPGGIAGANYLAAAADPWTPAFRSDVQVTVDGKKVPVIVLAMEHGTAIDFLILKEQYRALEVAKEDLRRDPNSVSAKKEIESLSKSIETRQNRLDKATSGSPR